MKREQALIEVQFPVSKVSKESYKERKANLGQTLTGLGKWWGRKPLVLVRAALLGLLLPASEQPKKDMEIFLKLLTMDQNGLRLRRNKPISAADCFEVCTTEERKSYFIDQNTSKWKAGLTSAEKSKAIEIAWERFSYDKKLTYCLRPEELENLPLSEWQAINAHLGTQASNLQELITELGEKRFGRRPIVGDCFCGGGSIPFEAARMGNDVFASDLNPIAGLLTWAALNIAGTSERELKELRSFQEQVYQAVDEQISIWGIETNEQGERANAYLYCTETICPECGYKLPLSPSWIIGKGTMTLAILKDNGRDGFEIEIKSGVTAEEMKAAEAEATVRDGKLYCLHCQRTVPMAALRKDTAEGYGLRQWGKAEFLPRETDTFRERLYCIRYTDRNGKRYYTTPTTEDLQREQRVISLLSERFDEWQEQGYLPDSEIEEGYNTSQLLRERGWKYWHQLFNPRQLLVHGLFMMKINEMAENQMQRIFGILSINRCANWNSKLCGWGVGQARESMAQTFYNQAFNTMWEETSRGISLLEGIYYLSLENTKAYKSLRINWYTKTEDARSISHQCDLWLTDPPYADAVNYHELSEFFLAWDKKLLKKAFPDWYTDSKRVLAVRGREQNFKNAMIEIYTNLAQQMPENGMQIIMFTHQDVSVWADLALIVWSAGLQVTAAWNIATETESGGLKDGNYVKGTVLLVLRKQTSSNTAYLDELYPDIEVEVKRQIESMRALDEQEEPNFSDADYILAAYAAALKVLTSVKKIEDLDIQYELSRERKKGELSPVAQLIEAATKIAYDQLIPREFDNFIWRSLNPSERFYIKGLELEKNNIYQLSAYQELARGFGVAEYKELMAQIKANTTRLKTGIEWGNRSLNGEDSFDSSLLRQVLMAVNRGSKEQNNAQVGKNWLRNEVADYWNKRERIVEFLKYIASFEAITNMKHWHQEAVVAKILKEAVTNDGI